MTCEDQSHLECGATDSATARVRAAIAKGSPPQRRDLEHALREAFGLSARKAKRFVATGARALGSEDDGLSELTERLAALERSLKV